MQRILSIFILFCFGVLLITLGVLSVDCISDNQNQYKFRGHYNFSIICIAFGSLFIIVSAVIGFTGVGSNMSPLRLGNTKK